VKALVETALGVLVVDLDAGELLDEEAPADLPTAEPLDVSLPRLLAAAGHGSTVVAAVDRRPPLLVSHDAGSTWRETGAGLPRVHAVAVHPEDPDAVVAAGAERLFVSRDGGRFWQALSIELPGIAGVALLD
jgi:hypothetical protein